MALLRARCPKDLHGTGTSILWWRDPQHLLSHCVVRDEPPSCGSRVVCLWKEGRKFLLASLLLLLRPQYSSMSISSVVHHPLLLGAGVITCNRSKEAGPSRVTAGTEFSLAPQGPCYLLVWVSGCYRRLVSNFWVSQQSRCHGVLPC